VKGGEREGREGEGKVKEREWERRCREGFGTPTILAWYPSSATAVVVLLLLLSLWLSIRSVVVVAVVKVSE